VTTQDEFYSAEGLPIGPLSGSFYSWEGRREGEGVREKRWGGDGGEMGGGEGEGMEKEGGGRGRRGGDVRGGNLRAGQNQNTSLVVLEIEISCTIIPHTNVLNY